MRRGRAIALCFGLTLAGLGIGYGVVAQAWPVHNRQPYHGYFRNIYDDYGTFVLPNKYGGQAIPSTMGSAPAFISFILNDLHQTTQEQTGAAFIIQTMIGNATNLPPTAAQIADWQDRVNTAASRGWITWNTNYCYTVNTFYQGASPGGPNPVDDAFFNDSSCAPAIVFRNSTGAVVYAIRRQCANPVGNGNIGTLEKANNFNMVGRSTVDNATPKPGDTIVFQHYVKNNGPDGAAAVWSVSVDSATGAAVTPAVGPLSYAPGQERNVATNTIFIPLGTPPNTKYCRQVGFDPVNGAGARNGKGAPVCATVRYDFGLTPSINMSVNGGPATSGFAEVGDKVDFTYSVNNVGTTASMSTTCTVNGKTYNGYHAVPSPNDTTSDPGYAKPATGCPRAFPLGNTTLVTETIAAVPAASANKTLCRALAVTPTTPTGGSKSVEVCIAIANKPYLRVYGGDVSAGNGFANAGGGCTNNSQGAIVGWNNEGPTYSGAAVQFGAFALDKIYDFSTSLGNGGGSAAPPSGLAFGNKTPSGGIFGGTFGSVPCATDFFGTKGATAPTSSPVNIGGLTTNSYTATAGSGQPVRIGGTLAAGRQVIVYVDGNVLIDSDIKLPNTWNMTNRPYFQLIVRGNIYISQNVTRLDGMYVAQPNGANGGIIYTCANPSPPATAVSPSGGSLFTNCKNQLIINGAFAAYSVQFLRVNGTLRQSTPAEPGNALGHAAEVFNFSPALWMAVPPGTTVDTDYDSITSLPPIL